MELKFNKLRGITLLLVSCLIVTSCFEDNDIESDVPKVVPFVYNFTGPIVGFVSETAEYSVRPRGGSDYVWTVNGAEMAQVSGAPHKINVTFTQFDQPVSVSVSEIVANGEESETSTMNVTVFGTPCTWTIEMQDSYGDGWNGGFLSFSYDGVAAGEIALIEEEGASATKTIDIPNGSEVEVVYNSGEYDKEVTYQIYDANGTKIFNDGPSPTVGLVFNYTNECPN
ncbi:hypothetical protein [Flagellimonas profundi]|uniref:PKD domain-containing protein n=1 Tax=Flagellimonas profundi TaxID=2915620 RepID=A0ABS3FJN5_9FLAO|nr:hypothetical protein [Allomuricauda profundi]MBO0343156.1 hypothetical protein [Allomuricauda profundi]